MKKALVISGGGSKGAFAGGVAEYLLKEKKNTYDIFLGTSTGSLMVSHLALGEIDALKTIYTGVNQRSIFNINPFRITNKNGVTIVNIRHSATLLSFLKGSKTFGESKNLRKLITKKITRDIYDTILKEKKEVVVTISNFTANRIEYKSIQEHSYEDFCDWIWGSCNYIPFMSLLEKNGYQYGDGGFGCLIPIREAIERGAKVIDAIILETEITQINRMPAKNPFSLLLTIQEFMMEHVEKHNITIGKLSAKQNNVELNLYYTPTVLTTNSLVFDRKKMSKWWDSGYEYAMKRDKLNNSEFRADIIDA
ncbi:patatin-like phospholipase family protein [Flavobacteriaceae bacterium]|jgi:predicted patatin/cPLA2 family phospholipase|nr:patatin-like phospholipase family protein [Flavobacteriaceae bacterium]MDB2417996.1 patatin-like phospholipase family protein [Flavobacteriaceae bacterium]MDB2657898.1 patatin-like phospholipase family protein [Flavobacteriaceae bacterium]MDG1980619.1 patatin-like phospholipase family protein [Flavobacteriaceae bacterium]|tara:strand:+ start:14320 stop:15243 length:924 start_codon:yes stop_codon:yes gene_type:complete